MTEYIYHVYYEGTLDITSEKKLSEDEICDLASDVIDSDARTQLNHHCSVMNIEVTDMEEHEYE